LQGDTISAEDGRIWEAQLLAERLLELKRGGFNVWDKEQEAYRPFRFGDAAILFRATTRLPLYEEQFKTLGLPYLTVSGRGYYSRPEVLDLIAWLAALYNPFDDFNLAVALRSPLFGLSDETLYRLRLHDEQGAPVSEPKPLWKALQSPPPSDQTGQVARANQVRIRLARMVDRCDVWTLLHTTIEETAYSAILAAADAQNAGGRQLRNVQKLLSIARDSGMIGLSDFLHRVDDLRAAEAREGEATGREPESGAVQLMSIHAAKGLEFPVLAVADLGRPARGYAAPQILHDPVFGLACKGRDEWGDWIKPAGYRWAEWLDGCMEEAESRRLLYVACTRAADLLLLSGKAGGKNTWLQTILAAWQVDVEGEEQEEIELDGYGLRVMRPVAAPESRSRQRSAGRSHPGLTEIPDLVAPLQPTESQPTISVTQLVRQISTVDAEPPRLQAVVRAQSSARQRRAPSYILGQVTHRVLAEWDLFYSDEVDQGGMVREISAAQGVERDTISDLVDTIVNILRRIRRDDLFAEIQSATSRYHEMPFSLTRPAEVLHGQIDLLFQDDHSGWTLVDWKTDWVTDGEQDRHIEQHGPQMALYTAAVEELLGVRPRALICLLCPRVNVYEYNDDELAGHMAQLGLS
jgi:ATP-dependent helicase/nuclease subunit A